MTLLQPIWLVLLIPLALAFYRWPMPTRVLQWTRAAVLLLLVLALCRPAVKLPDRAGLVVVVADRSESMPPESQTAQKEAVDLVQKSMGPRDQLAVVSFGRHAAVEQPPQQGPFSGFIGRVGADHSNLAEGIGAALNLVSRETPARLLVLSDGKWTGADPAISAARAANRQVAIDYRLIARPQADDLAIQQLLTPQSALPGESYMITAWIESPSDREIRFELRRNREVIASGSRAVPAGRSSMVFRDTASQPGVAQYELAVVSAGADPLPENNRARALVGISGQKPIHVVSESGGASGLARLLADGRVEIAASAPAAAVWSLEELARYSAVLIENVPANRIGLAGMETLGAWVSEAGGGLMMTGGKKSFGPGGYFGSPLEPIMPVSMELRQEHRKMALAIVVVMDRSGSMAAPAAGGRKKMDLANIGTAQVLDLLGPVDEFGVIAVDSSAHTIVELDSVEKNLAQRERILGIQSMGGGIFIFEALSAASKMVLRAKAETKHIILFADAADSEEPGRYQELLAHCRDAGITVSVVGLGQPTDVDARLLEDIAKRGEGNIYFTANAEEIPRLFVQDTFTVARSTFVEEQTPVKPTPAMLTIGGRPNWSPPALGGYNLTYLRPEAALPIVTTDEYAAPVVASWQAGVGRVLVYTGEADGKHTGPIAGWSDVGDFFATMARWTAGRHGALPDQMLLTQEIREGACHLQLHLDPERTGDPFAGLPVARLLHGAPGNAPAKASIPLQWKSADLLEAVIPIHGGETMLATVEIPGHAAASLPPVCLPYSPEFAPEDARRGRMALEQLASATSGRERLDLSTIWKDLPYLPRLTELTPYLILSCLALFLAEILQRRTGWFDFILAGRKQRTESVEAEVAVEGRKLKPVAAAAKRQPAPQAPAAARAKVEATKEATPEAASTLDALRQARQRARERRGGGK